MQLVLEVPDAVATRVVEAMATYYEYETERRVGETKAQFAKRMLIKHIREVVMYSVEGQAAVRQAKEQQRDNILISVNIT